MDENWDCVLQVLCWYDVWELRLYWQEKQSVILQTDVLLCCFHLTLSVRLATFTYVNVYVCVCALMRVRLYIETEVMGRLYIIFSLYQLNQFWFWTIHWCMLFQIKAKMVFDIFNQNIVAAFFFDQTYSKNRFGAQEIQLLSILKQLYCLILFVKTLCYFF